MFDKTQMTRQELFTAAAMLPVQDTLALRAWMHPDKTLFTFLDEEGRESDSLTYLQLFQKARAIAEQLHHSSLPGDRIVLLFPQCLDFIASFVACLMSDRIAVPVNLPTRRRLYRCVKIIEDSGATLALTPDSSLAELRAAFADAGVADLHWHAPIEASDNDDYIDWSQQPSGIDPDQVAFLQYTSGSTSDPKGVMVTHRNITTNLRMMRDSWELDHTTNIVTWQPHHHDMGLILGQLLPIVLGNHTVIMAPSTFVRQPSIWLQAISDYKATMAGGPNFAYNLAVERYSAERFKDLDLSNWTLALNGADVVRPTSLSRFCSVYEKHGFRATSFLPCYGLAEATLFVSGGPVRRPTSSIVADVRQLELEHRVVASTQAVDGRELMGCGEPSWEVDVAIINPETGRRCNPDEVGEIWISGETIAAGYWQNEKATLTSFRAQVADAPGRHFLRTGDLGFLGQQDRQLYICGRLKDLIICEGRNLHPEDIEYSVIESFDREKPQSCAVFCYDDDEQRQSLVAAIEVNREIKRCLNENAKKVKAAIRASVAENHGIPLNQIIFVLPTSMRKTTSGKIQRGLMRQLYVSGALEMIAS
ncbi:fatty acyl-AMP ligase [Billgrantia azerbaijanica]|nr:fatty acyl-AMP ligase [Halomonas azerbaijanica]